MMEMSSCFAPDGTRVAAETVDGEVIIIDLTTGVYYTMDAVAALIWSMLERNLSVEQMVDGVAQQYVVSPDRARDDIRAVLESLLEDRLIVSASPAAASEMPPGTGAKLPYTPPEVRTYGDLSDLLAMDLPVPALSPWRQPQQQLS